LHGFLKASHLTNHTTQVITTLDLNLKNRILSYSKDFLMGKMAQIHQISEAILKSKFPDFYG
jgi:hypothetical protein